MKVRYVGHSGFLVEWRACYWLFVYYFGKLPELDAGKRVFVFASHEHGDHWNPRVLDLRHEHPDVQYVLSSDIQLSCQRKIGFPRLSRVRSPTGNTSCATAMDRPFY